LYHKEIDRDDGPQGGDDQQQSTNDIGSHKFENPSLPGHIAFG
jgi:hypothetical protein